MQEEVTTAEVQEIEASASSATIAETEKDINPRTVRFSDALWYKPGLQAIVGGAGGIGSWLTLFLSRQDTEIFLFDFDTIDESNMGGQHFTTKDIGREKAEVMAAQAREFSGNHNVTPSGKYEEDSPSHTVVFSAFDNMAARKLMFEKWAAYIMEDDVKNEPAIFIDGRLLAEDLQIYAVTRDNLEKYRAYLWEDSEVEEVQCSFKATTHCSAIIAGLMTGIYNNYLFNTHIGAVARDVPLRTSLELATLMFNTKTND